MPYVNDMAILASSISDNLAETPEGFLVCKNVRIARIGVQEYYGEELGDEILKKFPEIRGKLVKVYRLPEEVFDRESMRSFESKPVSSPHPDGRNGITPDNASRFVKGHARNLRQDGDYLVADLVINDSGLIQPVRNKQIREVSCGYGCDYEPYKDGFKQTSITGNHIAVVEKGRAGPKVRINDSAIKGVIKKMNRKQKIAKMFASFAKDATPEEVLEMASILTEDEESVPAAKSQTSLMAKMFSIFAKDDDGDEDEDKAKKEKEDKDKTEDALKQQVKELQATVDALKAGKKKQPATTADILDSLFALDEDKEDDKEKTEDEDEMAEDEDEEKKTEDRKHAADAAVKAVLTALKPTIAKLPAKEQQIAKDAIRAELGKAGTTSDYSKITQIVSKVTKDHQASEGVVDFKILGEKISEKYNPHYQPKITAAELMASK